MTSLLATILLACCLMAVLLGVRLLTTRALHANPVSYSLQFPAGLDQVAVERLVVGIASLLPPAWRRLVTQPVVAFEVSATSVGISHRLVVPRSVRGVVESHLIAHVPSIRWDVVGDVPLCPMTAVEYRTTTDRRPLRCDSAGLSASLLASLQPLSGSDTVCVQWLLAAGAPVMPPRLATGDGAVVPVDGDVFDDAEGLGAARSKYRDLLVLAVGRIGVKAATSERATTLLRQVEAPLNAQRSIGVEVTRRVLRRDVVARRMARRAIPLLAFPARLNIEEAAGVICWPISIDSLPGLELGGCPLLPVAAVIPERGTELGVATFPGMKGRPVAMDGEARRRHLAITGPTGTGKSNLMARLLQMDMQAGHAVVLLDPKGDGALLATRLVPEHRIDDVIYLDAGDVDCPVGYNPIATGRGISSDLVAEQVLGVMASIWADYWGPRTDEIARGVLYTLTQHGGFTLCEVPALLTSAPFRAKVLAGIDDPHGVEEFWESYASWSERERNQAIPPVLNKARSLTMRSQLRGVLGQSEGLDFNTIIADKRILLANLAAGRLGTEAANLLAAWLFSGLWNAISARASVAESDREFVAAHLDEYRHLTALATPANEILAEARGYNLGVTLAAQALSLLDRDLAKAVMANCRSKILMQTSRDDAVLFAKEFGHGLTPENLMGLPAWEAVASLYAQGAVQPPATIHTLPVVPLRASGDEVIERSRQRWGTPRVDVDAAIAKRHGPKARKRRGSSSVGQRRRSDT